jgi:hypothetical protein
MKYTYEVFKHTSDMEISQNEYMNQLGEEGWCIFHIKFVTDVRNKYERIVYYYARKAVND